MIKTTLRIGPKDQGRRMALREFEPAAVKEGYLYELARGIISVSEVPGLPHPLVVDAVRRQLFRYQEDFEGEVYVVLGTMECKLLVEDFESERHPDLAVYKTKPLREADLWYHWTPEIVVEVVSTDSARRDYVEKKEEYLALGIKEYWIVDSAKQQMTVLRRTRGKWSERVLNASDSLETKLLPGFRLDCGKIFQAAEQP
ncbi:MAG TPA: Uma2 family endonuclease [Gemmataceae bacterium]|jgi:Uma2 family endonuclease|nr:Uma2 family endonuclease [Gemmataceae bacterium]